MHGSGCSLGWCMIHHVGIGGGGGGCCCICGGWPSLPPFEARAEALLLLLAQKMSISPSSRSSESVCGAAHQ